MSFDPEPFVLSASLLNWLTIFGTAFGAVFVVALLSSLLTMGTAGVKSFLQFLRLGIIDNLSLSPKRILALANLTIKESIRRKTLAVFVVFAILFMFAGWFLANSNENSELQINVYISFVLTAASWLILPVALLMSCWGLPTDIKDRSLHTVVTKPVRRGELVLGRILGYSAVCTSVLLIMGIFGYFWILRQIPDDIRHELVSRVPFYGQLTFTDNQGNPKAKGVNVGNVWDFRSYIQGGTKARAIYEFPNVTPELLHDQETLVLESRFEAFRMHKGNMNRSLQGQYYIINKETERSIPLYPLFEVKEFSKVIFPVPRKIQYTTVNSETGEREPQTFDLIDDLLSSDGSLTIEVQCLDQKQYFGMARPDLFIRPPDKPFSSSFFKALFGIWMMVNLVLILGVTASCFLKGPVAILLAFTLVLVGGTDFYEFFGKLINDGGLEGFGTFESLYRLLTHKGPNVDLEQNLGTDIIFAIDKVISKALKLVYSIIPNFNQFRLTAYPAHGFDVPWSTALFPCIGTLFAYILPCFLVGYFSLRIRELEAK